MSRERNVVLAVDVGNTNVTIGAFIVEDLRDSWRISTDRHRMADEYRPLLDGLLRSSALSYGVLEVVVMASVVPPVAAELSAAFRREGVEVLTLSGGNDFGLAVRYEPRTSVGADRLANALAVDQKYGRPAIIVDVGTATTLDVLDAEGTYIGGAIAPGIELSMEALFSRAFQLPRLAPIAPNHAIGGTTVESIRSGIVLGTASLVDGLIERFRAEIEGEPVIVGTGGYASLIGPHSKYIKIIDLDVTLVGLRLAYERSQRTCP